MRPYLEFEVLGTPAPQGSKRHVGHGIMVESSAKVKPWREAVKFATPAMPTPLTGPVSVLIVFYVARPKGHYGTGRNAERIRYGAPYLPATRPDLDKLVRSSLDALGESGVFRDDAQVTTVMAHKIYADTRPPGAQITITAPAWTDRTP